MKVLILAQGPEQIASSRTRVFAYLPYLDRAGIPYDLLVWNSERFVQSTLKGAAPVLDHARNLLRHWGIVAKIAFSHRKYRTIFVQKVVLPTWLLGLLRVAARRVVFDYDDALYALAPQEDRGIRSWVRRGRTRRFLRMLSGSDCVVLENEPNRAMTEQYCDDIVLITGPIDTVRYQPRPRADAAEVVLGWVGSPSTSVYLQMLKPVLQELVQRGRRIRLHLIGATPFDVPGVPVTQTAWTLAGEVEALATFDVGLMPLTDDPWSRGKGGYKILQYMAMGIPVVASPVGINSALVDDGATGYLATETASWLRALDCLITNAALRRRMGDAARTAALARHSIEHHAPALLRALEPGGSSEEVLR